MGYFRSFIWKLKLFLIDICRSNNIYGKVDKLLCYFEKAQDFVFD